MRSFNHYTPLLSMAQSVRFTPDKARPPSLTWVKANPWPLLFIYEHGHPRDMRDISRHPSVTIPGIIIINNNIIIIVIIIITIIIVIVIT